MPTIRIGFSSDFVLKNGVVGLGTTVGSTTDGKLELDNGALRANLSVSGVATLTAYGGFVAQKQHVNKPATIGFGTVGLQTAGVGTAYQYYETETGFTDLGGVHHGDDQYFNTLSEDLVIDDGQILNITNTDMVGVTTIGEYDPHNHSSYVCAGSLEQVSVTGHFSVPNGGINDRQLTPIEGTVRFNDDLNTLEFFNGNEWRQFTYNQGQSGRGVFGGGGNPSRSPVYANEIDFVNIQTLGNAQDFGDLTADRNNLGACSSEIRGIFAAGNDSSYLDVIDYITIASQGNAIDFGNVSTTNRSYVSCCSSSTRGLFNGGYTTTPSNQTVNIIDRIEISTIGNAVDFGDLFHKVYAAASTSSTTRAIIAGGVGTPDLGTNPSTRYGQIQKYEIGSGGTSIDFGQLNVARWNVNGMSNGTRGVFGGGQVPTYFSVIDYVTIASEGNSLEFGELSTVRDGVGATANKTRGLFAGGRESTSPGSNGINVIEYITMASLGNPLDFGDLTVGRHRFPGLSDSHGGLGGF